MVRESGGLLDEGIARFNQGQFFEAHEVWEGAWKRSEGPDRMFLQGLIQAAAAILHIERGNPRGAATLYAKAKSKLDIFDNEYQDVALDEFRLALDRFFTRALAEELADETFIERPRIRRAAASQRNRSVPRLRSG